MPSKVIARFDYDAATGRLVIQFVNGRHYAYDGVPPAVVDGFRNAGSKGQYFSVHIRDHYPFKQLKS